MTSGRLVGIAAAVLALTAGVARAQPAGFIFDVTGHVRQYSVPDTGIYDLSAFGGQGGSVVFNATRTVRLGGLGAAAYGSFLLTAGDVLDVTVGGKGDDGAPIRGAVDSFPGGSFGQGGAGGGGAGGGGGSYVVRHATTTPLLIAGGGGGAGYDLDGDGGQGIAPLVSGNAGGNGTGGKGGGGFGGGGGSGFLSAGQAGLFSPELGMCNNIVCQSEPHPREVIINGSTGGVSGGGGGGGGAGGGGGGGGYDGGDGGGPGLGGGGGSSFDSASNAMVYPAVVSGGGSVHIARAANVAWAAAGDGNWDDAANWGNGAAPGFSPVVIAPANRGKITGPAADTTIGLLALGDGASAVTLALGAGALSVPGGVTINPNATLSGGGKLQGPLTNNGRIQVAAGETLALDGALSNQGLFGIAEGGTATFLGSVTGAGGFTGGGAAVFENLRHIGNSPAVVRDTAADVFDAASTLSIDLGGLVPGTCEGAGCAAHGQVIFDGGVRFNGGMLEIDLYNGFVPAVGEAFHILIYGATHTGSFGALSLPALDTGLSWNTDDLYTTGSISIVSDSGVMNAVPEPAGTAAILAGAAVPALRSRRDGAGTR